MELDAFVEETLLSIMRGVSIAVKKHSDLDIGGWINPISAQDTHTIDYDRPEFVDFDVSLTVEKVKDQDSSGKFRLAIVEVKHEQGVQNKETGVSRVKFRVPIQMPSYGVRGATIKTSKSSILQTDRTESSGHDH